VGFGRFGNDKIRGLRGLKSGSKIRVLGTPGRGVLRFLAEAYRRPVHFLAKNTFFSKNVQT